MFIYIYIYTYINYIHHVPTCLNCHKAILVITRQAHYFHDCICVMPILLPQNHSMNITVYIYIYIYIYIYMVFTTKRYLEVTTESWPKWDLNPRPLHSIQTL